MNSRPVLIHGLLLAAAMVAAYFVWTREPSDSEDEIPILSLRGGLDRVVYSAPDRVVELERRKDATGEYHWVNVQTVQEKPAPTPPAPPASAPTKPPAAPKAGDKTAAGKADAGKAKVAAADAGPAPKKPVKPKMIKVTKEQAFKGNKAADDLVNGLAKLSAIRSLGKVEKKKLKEFGLADSKKTLSLVSGSAPRVFIVGGKTYGNMDIYLQDKQDKRVYVIRPRLVQDLQYAEFRLVDRQLVDFTPTDVERVALIANKARKELIHKNRRDPAGAHWVDAREPERKRDLYKNFIGKLLRLQGMEYVQPKKAPAGLQELLTVALKLASGKMAKLTLLRDPSPAPPPPTKGPKPAATATYYARSSNTRALVKVNARLADELARDIPSVMAE